MRIEETSTNPKFGCLMLFLTANAAEEFIDWSHAKVKESDLADDGFEPEPHITVLYGFHEDVTASEIESTIGNWGYVEVSLGPVSRFERDEYDVLKIDVESDSLRALNSMLAEKFGGRVTNKFPEFQAHMTIAYVKKGSVAELDGDMDYYEKTFKFNVAVFSNKDKERYLVSLRSEHGA